MKMHKSPTQDKNFLIHFFFTMLAGLEKSSSLIFCDRINFRPSPRDK